MDRLQFFRGKLVSGARFDTHGQAGGTICSVMRWSSFSCVYGPDAFCKLLVRDVETVCMHVSGLPAGQLPKHARSLDEIRAPRP